MRGRAARRVGLLAATLLLVGSAAAAPPAEETAGTQPAGFLAVPKSGDGSGVLVLHAWWGLNGTTKAFCTRLADAGFLAFAPDLYGGKVADTVEDAKRLASALDATGANAEVADAARLVAERVGAGNSGIAVVGFSLGASFALDLAEAEPARVRSVVLFYGTGGGDVSHSRAAYLGHFAENDPFEPRAGVDALEAALRKAGRPVTFHHYAGTGHWFFEPDRGDAYDRAAAELAWERTLAFLKQARP
jgi:carboxymethylenebutenolidase